MTPEWYSTSWFAWDTLRSFAWGQKLFLYGIALIPLLFLVRWGLFVRFRQKLALSLPGRRLGWSLMSLLRFVPDLLVAVVVALILVALARPQRVNQRVELSSSGIDIMLVMDVSRSMLALDFQPNRLEVAKRLARNFINKRFQDRIGVVVFAGDAYSLAPLTTDYNLLNDLIKDVNHNMIQNPETALGTAIAVTINRMRESKSKSKVAIIISDGESAAGNIAPLTAARLAKANQLKLYTILVGREGLVQAVNAEGKVIQQNNTVDETIMRTIAEIGEGRFYRASNVAALQSIFKQIDQYEKAPVVETRYKDTEDFYQIYLRWALVFLVAWIASKCTFMNNILED
jgi:Ca-activated chloride channel family protein